MSKDSDICQKTDLPPSRRVNDCCSFQQVIKIRDGEVFLRDLHAVSASNFLKVPLNQYANKSSCGTNANLRQLSSHRDFAILNLCVELAFNICQNRGDALADCFEEES